jgi:putative ABC transport system substrate-binding protein
MTDTHASTSKSYRIGLFSYAPLVPDRIAPLKQKFADLGYHEGKNIAFDVRSSDRDKAVTARHAAELVASEPDLIWAMNTNAAVAAREAMGSKHIPVVFWATDPVESGIVDDIQTKSHFTGFAAPIDLQLLQLRFIKATFPGLTRVPLLYNPTYGPAPSSMRQFHEEATLYGMSIDVCEVQQLGEIEPVLSRIGAEHGKAFLVGPHALFNTNGKLIGELALKYRLAAVAVQESIVRGGGLVSFFPTSRHIQAGILSLIDRILKGTPPEQIPIDRKIGFSIVINGPTIQKLDLRVPGFLLTEADEIMALQPG